MLIGEKINLKKYLGLSILLIIISLRLSKNNSEIIAMAIIFAAACLNQWMLVNSVRDLTNSAVDGTISNKSSVVFMVIGKLILLIVALTFGVQIMGKRIIIPVLIYVLQIGVLYISFENKTNIGKDFK